jgi:hypothetical protein
MTIPRRVIFPLGVTLGDRWVRSGTAPAGGEHALDLSLSVEHGF